MALERAETGDAHETDGLPERAGQRERDLPRVDAAVDDGDAVGERGILGAQELGIVLGDRHDRRRLAQLGFEHRPVDVEVVSRHGSVQMVIRDRHRPPPEPGLSEDERWKRAGLTPKGKVIKTEAK